MKRALLLLVLLTARVAMAVDTATPTSVPTATPTSAPVKYDPFCFRGTGGTNSIALPFQPAVSIEKIDTRSMVMRTEDMDSTISALLTGATSTTDITDLTASGVSLGTDGNKVNRNACSWSFTEGAGLEVVTWTGDVSDTTVTLSKMDAPNALLVVGGDALGYGTWLMTDQIQTDCGTGVYDIANKQCAATATYAAGATGQFVVGGDWNVNTKRFYGIAVHNTANVFAVGYYDGNGASMQDVPTTCKPTFVLVFGTDAYGIKTGRIAAINKGDTFPVHSWFFQSFDTSLTKGGDVSDIMAIGWITSSFVVGPGANTQGQRYYYVVACMQPEAVATPTPTATVLGGATATPSLRPPVQLGATPTPSLTLTPTDTPTITQRVTVTDTPTVTVTPTKTGTPTITQSFTPTDLSTVTPTATFARETIFGEWSANWTGKTCQINGEPTGGETDTTYGVISGSSAGLVDVEDRSLDKSISTMATNVRPESDGTVTSTATVNGVTKSFTWHFNSRGVSTATIRWMTSQCNVVDRATLVRH